MKKKIIYMVVTMVVAYYTLSCFCGKFSFSSVLAKQPDLEIESPSACLMELNTGQILYEKDADSSRKPASVTKIMTMLLAFEAIDSGKMKLEDNISVSSHAAGMGGSQVYLEEGEIQSFQSLLKCMIVSSANDAATAIAEAISGSEESFVSLMNERATQLGMNNSHFENACGLEAENHKMSARDIAVLSRELIQNHSEVFQYSTIWMDTIIHKTRKGESEFGLANTNKFLKRYNGANGLKTGYTSAAGFSMSATATRDGVTLIAVVMGSDTKEMRYRDAEKLLNFGFSNCHIYKDDNVLEGKKQLDIQNGTKLSIGIKEKNPFQYVFVHELNDKKINKKWIVVKNSAPISKGDVVARMQYEIDGKKLGHVDLIAVETVKERNWKDVFFRLVNKYVLECKVK